MGLTGRNNISLNWDKAVYKELNLITSISSTHCSWNYTINFVKEKKINLETIVSHKFPFSDFRQAFELANNKKCMKILLFPD